MLSKLQCHFGLHLLGCSAATVVTCGAAPWTKSGFGAALRLLGKAQALLADVTHVCYMSGRDGLTSTFRAYVDTRKLGVQSTEMAFSSEQTQNETGVSVCHRSPHNQVGGELVPDTQRR
jgi:hypothetical protein